ncbi:hypothetical protein [Methylobacterium sp. 10]|uniref:hypothetical protein n=1 Tax=Methylobacterium sp. 10 TaxID=1101191 RepID=UPI000481D32C|nr:hypothetical protein [Methylobacterium sp. 10]
MATPLLTLVPAAADPILAAIAVHRDAWRDFANATPESVTETALAQRTAMADHERAEAVPGWQQSHDAEA